MRVRMNSEAHGHYTEFKTQYHAIFKINRINYQVFAEKERGA